ncbi:MAG: 30S ribosomal protein S1 [Candidatus Babeliaceae bacterium]|jgi:small subunit ribosomal protein S1
MSKEFIKPKQFAAAQPQWDDAEFGLNPEQKQELASLYDGTVNKYKPGSIIKGTVIATSADGVLVDISYKSDGLIPLYEFTEHELKKLTPQSEIEVIIDELENFDGNVILSYEKAKALKAWDSIMKLYDEGKPVEGLVTHKVKGGLSVDIGIPAFLPGSQVDVQRVNDFDQFVNQYITAYIIKVNQKRGNVIISRRKYLNEQRSEVRKKILDSLQPGQVIQGTVKNITNYGVFIDIGGVDGLLHITDMTWGRIAHPSELLKIGETITVKVISFDKNNEKISLGIKQLAGNPWEHLPEDVQVGSTVKGTISSITDYGLFVEVAKGVEGLIHISEISWTDRITDLAKHYKVGDTIEALVVSLDKENRRMSLSIKQLEKNPWEEITDQFVVGQKIKGKISNITDFGIFVQLMRGVDGLVHISDLSWTEHIKHPADIYHKGDEVEAIITDINKQKKKISLGIKQLTENPWENIEQKYPVGSLVDGEISKITDFGAFVKLDSGIEGLVHISELSGNNVNKVEDIVKVGQRAQFRVIKVSQEDHKLGLSLKADQQSEQRENKPSHKKEQRAEKQPSRREKHTEQVGPKAKSQFQLELERHAAARNYTDEDNNE